MSNPDRLLAEIIEHLDLVELASEHHPLAAGMTRFEQNVLELHKLMKQGRVPVEWERERGYGGQDRH